MGCSSSSPSWADVPKSRIGVKLLVLPDKESQCKNTIMFFNLAKCRMEGSIKIPLAEGINSSGFTLAAHPRRPTLYVTGSDTDSTQRVYQLSLQGCNTELTESRVNLPENFLPHISVVACVGEEEYLYVFNAQGDCHRLDLTLNALEHIEKPKGPATTLKQVLVVKSSLFMVMDESLWVLDQTDLECMWAPVVESSFPSGLYAVLNDIYILDIDGQKVTRYATLTSSFEDIKDFACKELQTLISLVGFGDDSIHFTEAELNSNGTQSEKQVWLKNYSLSKHKVVKVGILKGCPLNHKLGLCWA